MDFLKLILDQIEQNLGREMTQNEKDIANSRIKDEVRAIELYISAIARKYVRSIRDSGN